MGSFDLEIQCIHIYPKERIRNCKKMYVQGCLLRDFYKI